MTELNEYLVMIPEWGQDDVRVAIDAANAAEMVVEGLDITQLGLGVSVRVKVVGPDDVVSWFRVYRDVAYTAERIE